MYIWYQKFSLRLNKTVIMDTIEHEQTTSILQNESQNHQQMADDIQVTSTQAKPKKWYGVRHTQISMLFLLILIGYGMRVNLSVGIVAMTDPNANENFPTYNWTIKSTILSSFFWGYVLPQVGVGQLAERYGSKWFLTGSMLISALFTALIPIMAELGAWGVMICRVVQGFTQGFFYPCTHNLLSRWIPLSERSRMGTFVYAGGPLGTVIAMPLTGWISSTSIGWPSIFYIYGVLGFVWTGLWLWLGSNGPSDHKTISDEERMYIEKSCQTSKQRVPTPWKDMAKSLPLWSILIAHCGQNWGFWTLMTEIPTYMNSVLHFDIASNGLLSAAPYFALWILSFFFSYVTDLLINRKICSVATARKIVTNIGLVGPAISLVILGLIDSSHRGAVIALLIIAVGINSAIYCGYQVNHIDIAPNHAGTLMGITNGAANILSICAPLLVEFVVTNDADDSQWMIVWFIAAGIYVVCDLSFTFFGKGELLYWNNIEECDCKDGDTKKNEEKLTK